MSNPPSDTDQTRVGDPAAINFATIFNCCCRFDSPPAFPPFTVGKSSVAGVDSFRIGVIVLDKSKRFLIDVAATAISFESLSAGAESFRQSVASRTFGITRPPRGKTDPEYFAPAKSGGSTDPKLIASIGSRDCESTQRPSHPVLR